MASDITELLKNKTVVVLLVAAMLTGSGLNLGGITLLSPSKAEKNQAIKAEVQLVLQEMLQDSIEENKGYTDSQVASLKELSAQCVRTLQVQIDSILWISSGALTPSQYQAQVGRHSARIKHLLESPLEGASQKTEPQPIEFP